MAYQSQLVGAAQDLGDGRFGVLVEMDGQTYYVEHAVSADGLSAQVWDESRDELVNERQMGWAEVIERMMTAWQATAGDAVENGDAPS